MSNPPLSLPPARVIHTMHLPNRKMHGKKYVSVQHRKTGCSRIERGEQTPKLEHALRYALLFDLPMEQVVPALCKRIQNALWEDLILQLNAMKDESVRGKQKRAVLANAMARIDAARLPVPHSSIVGSLICPTR